jgi:hypothetical protein
MIPGRRTKVKFFREPKIKKRTSIASSVFYFYRLGYLRVEVCNVRISNSSC